MNEWYRVVVSEDVDWLCLFRMFVKLRWYGWVEFLWLMEYCKEFIIDIVLMNWGLRFYLLRKIGLIKLCYV